MPGRLRFEIRRKGRLPIYDRFCGDYSGGAGRMVTKDSSTENAVPIKPNVMNHKRS